jgi:hypothetical protein
MPGTRWIKVDAKIIECFRAWEEPRTAAHPWFDIVADVKSPAGDIERVSARQKLYTRTHHWRSPDPGDVVPAKWNPAHRELRLVLGGDPRYDEKLIKTLARSRTAPWPGPPGGSGGPS